MKKNAFNGLQILIYFFLYTSKVQSEWVKSDDLSIFNARISKVNTTAGLLRLRVDYSNIKFMSKGDQLEIFMEDAPERRCPAIFMGKETKYILLKIPHFELCIDFLSFNVGGSINISSKDLQKNLVRAQEVLEILVKKKLVLEGNLNREKQNISSYNQKVDLINQRYQLLKSKLELEWQDQLTALEVDKVNVLKKVKEFESDLFELEKKLEQYHIDDKNIMKDRWSLDRRIYRTK